MPYASYVFLHLFVVYHYLIKMQRYYWNINQNHSFTIHHAWIEIEGALFFDIPEKMYSDIYEIQ